MSALDIQHLSRQWPGEPQPSVDDVSLTIPAGQFTVLLGPSGCGKTTLLKMINRLYEPTSGQILIDGIDTATLRATELRRKIGYVIQQTGLFPHMTIAKNIAVVPDLLGWERDKTNARIDELLDLVGLPHTYRERFPRQLSGGEQQRVGVARALAADPSFILMDEPFGAIDAITRDRLQDELLRIQRRVRKTILFVTHDVEEALKLADRIVVMRKGKIVQYDTPLALVSHPADDFVRDLVGADDLLRRLSLLYAADISRPVETIEPHATTTSADTDLRTLVAQLLASKHESLVLTNGDGVPVGQVSFDDIRASLRAG